MKRLSVFIHILNYRRELRRYAFTLFIIDYGSREKETYHEESARNYAGVKRAKLQRLHAKIVQYEFTRYYNGRDYQANVENFVFFKIHESI